MDYKEKYNKLVEAVKVLQEENPSDEGIQNWVNDNVPELRESEDEKTRKEIVGYLKKNLRYEWATWLEKQGGNVSPIEGFTTEFERQVSSLIASSINKEYSYTQDYVKWVANALFNYAKKELEKQGEQKPDAREKYKQQKK